MRTLLRRLIFVPPELADLLVACLARGGAICAGSVPRQAQRRASSLWSGAYSAPSAARACRKPFPLCPHRALTRTEATDDSAGAGSQLLCCPARAASTALPLFCPCPCSGGPLTPFRALGTPLHFRREPAISAQTPSRCFILRITCTDGHGAHPRHPVAINRRMAAHTVRGSGCLSLQNRVVGVGG